ncbi:hypothetical protein RIF29_10488 [Crotalaria pallida]|uniref:VOC domain-containing protein n=1 Tax=Crotalaria pallida TaxID=3830 RepID=A0AAN9FVT0_CROPI
MLKESRAFSFVNEVFNQGSVNGGSTTVAFIEDPDGYKFELLDRGPTPEPLCQVMLRVGDLDRGMAFYQKALGLQLLRKRDNPAYKMSFPPR